MHYDNSKKNVNDAFSARNYRAMQLHGWSLWS